MRPRGSSPTGERAPSIDLRRGRERRPRPRLLRQRLRPEQLSAALRGRELLTRHGSRLARAPIRAQVGSPGRRSGPRLLRGDRRLGTTIARRGDAPLRARRGKPGGARRAARLRERSDVVGARHEAPVPVRHAAGRLVGGRRPFSGPPLGPLAGDRALSQVETSVIIPTLDDAATLGKTIENLNTVIAAVGAPAEVLVPDARDPLELVPKMVAELRAGAHLVLCSRFDGKGSAPNVPRRFVIYQALYRRAIRLLLGVDIADSTYGFRAFNRTFVQALGITGRRFAVCSEITFKVLLAEGKTVRVRGVPTGPMLQSQNKFRLGNELADYAFTLVRAALHRARLRWF